MGYCDAADGETQYREFHHDSDDFRGFYSGLTGRVIVGQEAAGYGAWFEQLLAGLGHKVRLGDAVEVRRRAGRRQKNDRRDAELILDLLLFDDEPPHVGGLELVRRARALPRRWLTPIVMLSAGGAEPEAWRAGVDALLKSPRDVTRLLELVARIRPGKR